MLAETTSRDLRVLICEDEYLLAMDMAEQFVSLGAEVVGIAGSIGALRTAINEPDFSANAVVLDLQYVDGKAFDIIPDLEKTGAAIVVCSGYDITERPQQFAHIPWIGKPADAFEISNALCATLNRPGGCAIV